MQSLLAFFMKCDFAAASTKLFELETVGRFGLILFGVIVNLVAHGAFKMNYRSGCFFLGHFSLLIIGEKNELVEYLFPSYKFMSRWILP